jgi:hypothetical protein
MVTAARIDADAKGTVFPGIIAGDKSLVLPVPAAPPCTTLATTTLRGAVVAGRRRFPSCGRAKARGDRPRERRSLHKDISAHLHFCGRSSSAVDFTVTLSIDIWISVPSGSYISGKITASMAAEDLKPTSAVPRSVLTWSDKSSGL